MSSTPKRHYYSSAAATRPDISPEEEAKLCALPLILVRDLHKRLENSEPGPSLREAIDDCVKWLSIPLTEAAPILELPLKKLSNRDTAIPGAFQHKGKWRIWIAVIKLIDESLRPTSSDSRHPPN